MTNVSDISNKAELELEFKAISDYLKKNKHPVRVMWGRLSMPIRPKTVLFNIKEDIEWHERYGQEDPNYLPLTTLIGKLERYIQLLKNLPL